MFVDLPWTISLDLFKELVRRIEIQPKAVYWSETGELCCIATEESYFVLKYDSEIVANADKDKASIKQTIIYLFSYLPQIVITYE